MKVRLPTKGDALKDYTEGIEETPIQAEGFNRAGVIRRNNKEIEINER